MKTLGTYPTPVERLDSLSTDRTSFWVKRDDLTHPLYGGNKVRKLEHVLADATARGASRILTIGAAGSHHVLATAVHAKEAGLGVDAVMVPQPRTDHVVQNLRADLARGVRVFPAMAWALVPILVLLHWRRGVYFLTTGGSNVSGAMGYVDAARELASQVRAGVLPEPDVIVVTLGSGGTAAGLAAGLELEKLKTRVVGIAVASPVWFLRWATHRLARACVRRADGTAPRAALKARLVIDDRYLGRGYGYATAKGSAAIETAAKNGLTLDPTYTAKAFAAAIDRVASGSYANVLYWHTLSSAPMPPLLADAPSEDAIDTRVRRLLR
jgi:1-aminocyclopropane-1-carboxylate deaminase/D-cysteine desulfhydrase-like pyridoxal-dependent ACC family enzyme